MARTWPRSDELGLARFVDPDAKTWFPPRASRYDQGSGGRTAVVADLYDTLRAHGVRYELEPYHPDEYGQLVRSPNEVAAQHEGTCLDLALLFCGLCLGSEFLPVVVVLEGHALAVVSLAHGAREEDLPALAFGEDPRLSVADLLEKVERGDCVAVECTGVARSERLRALDRAEWPETVGRGADGTMTFERAAAAGLEQLRLAAVGAPARPFRFALNLYSARYLHGFDPHVASVAGDVGILVGDRVDAVVAEHAARPLVGRDADLVRLDALVDAAFDGESGGRVLLTAGAGSGKTALLAHWVDRLRWRTRSMRGAGPFLVFHFVNRNEPFTRTADQVARNLWRQLRRYHGTGDGPGDDVASRVYSLLRDEGGRRGPLLIVLDALDEADSDLSSLLPQRLPRGVCVVASARTAPGPLPEYLHRWAQDAQRWELPPLPSDGVREWLCRLGNEELRRRADDAGFVQAVTDRTEGLPLHVRYLVEDLEQAGDGSADEVLARTPRGLRQYVRQQFDGLAEDLRRTDPPSPADECWDLLAVLAVAKAPLYESELREFAGRVAGAPPTYLKRQRAVARWLRVVEDADESAYAFEQARLADLFADLYPDQAAQAGRRILALGWQAPTGSGYALRHYAEHLLDAVPDQGEDDPVPEERNRLYALARDPAFRRAQEKRFPAEPDLPLRTLQTAIEGAARTDDAAGLAEFLVHHLDRLLELRAGRPDRHRNEPNHPGELTDLTHAWELADLAGADRSVLWHLLLAWQRTTEGREPEAVATLRRLSARSLPRLSGWDASAAAFLLAQLVERYTAETGPLLAALLDADGLYELLNFYFDRGPGSDGTRRPAPGSDADPTPAPVRVVLRVAEAIPTRIEQVSIRSAAAQVFLRAGDPAAARALVPVPIPTDLPLLLQLRIALLTARTHVDLGDAARAVREPLDRAAELAAAIEEPSARWEAERDVVAALAGAGDLDGARHLAAGIAGHEYRAQALLAVARRAGAADRDDTATLFDEARQAARAVGVIATWHSANKALDRDPSEQRPTEPPPSPAKLAMVRAYQGHRWVAAVGFRPSAGADAVVTAVDTARRDGAPAADLVALQLTAALIRARIGGAATAEHLFAGARRAVLSLPTPEDRAAWAIVAGVTEVKAGRAVRAAATFTGAIDAVASVADDADQADATTWVSRLLIEFRQLTWAAAAADRVRDPSARVDALLAVARQQRTDGDVPEASGTVDRGRRAAEEITDGLRRVDALIAIALEQHANDAAPAAADTLTRATHAAEEAVDDAVRASALAGVASALARCGRPDEAARLFDRASSVAAALPDEQTRAKAQQSVVTEQSRAGQHESARAAADRITDASTRALALFGVGMDAERHHGPGHGRPALAAARAAAAAIDEPENRAAVLIALAGEHIAAAQFDEAETALVEAHTAAGTISAMQDRSIYLVLIADAAVGLSTAAALEVASTVDDPEYRALAFTRLAEKFGGANRRFEMRACLHGAYTAAFAVDDVVDRAGALAHVVHTWSQVAPDLGPPAADDRGVAEVFVQLVVAATLRQPFGPVRQAARAVPDAGDRDALRQAVDLVEQADRAASSAGELQRRAAQRSRLQVELLVEIGEAQAELQDASAARATLTDAVKVVSNIGEPANQVLASLIAARGQADAGFHDDAEETLAGALRAAESVPDRRDREFLVASTWRDRAVLTGKDEGSRAVTAARAIADPQDRLVALHQLGAAWRHTDAAEAERLWTEAGTVAAALPPGEEQRDAVVRLTRAWLQVDDHRRAWETVNLLVRDPSSGIRRDPHARVLRLEIVTFLARTGSAPLAQEIVARLLAPEPERATRPALWALAALVRVLLRHGAPDEARAVVDRIDDEAVRRVALAELADAERGRVERAKAAPRAAVADAAAAIPDDELSWLDDDSSRLAVRTLGPSAAPTSSTAAARQGATSVRTVTRLRRTDPSRLRKESNRRLQDEALERAEQAAEDPGQRSRFEQVLIDCAHFNEATYQVLPLLGAVYRTQADRVATVLRDILNRQR